MGLPPPAGEKVAQHLLQFFFLKYIFFRTFLLLEQFYTHCSTCLRDDHKLQSLNMPCEYIYTEQPLTPSRRFGEPLLRRCMETKQRTHHICLVCAR
jgi:hypothetical protein